MLISVFFTFLVFSVMSLLTFFIAKEVPKGEFKSLKYTSLPGIMTPNTLKSREACIAAHTAMSPYFTLLSVFFSVAGIVSIILIFMESQFTNTFFTVGMLVGIAFFAVLVWRGDRVAANLPGDEVS